MNRIVIRFVMLSVVVFCSMHAVFAQKNEVGYEDAAVPPEMEEQPSLELEKVEEYFSSPIFADRQRAMQFIWGNPRRSAVAVQRAALSGDPEVAGRAKWILEGWQRGNLHASGLWGGNPDSAGSKLGELLAEARFDALMFVLEVTTDEQRLIQVRKEMEALILSRFSIYVQAALQHKKLLDFANLIGVIAETREMALCRLQLLQLVDADVETHGLLPQSSKSWTPQLRNETEVLLLYQCGRANEAIERARQLENRNPLQVCQILDSRWKEMSLDALSIVEDVEAGSKDAVRAWSRVLTAAERDGNDELRDRAIDHLTRVVRDEEEDVSSIRWKSLAMHGQLAAAFQILDPLKPHLSAEVALASSQPGHAFGVLGYPLESVDSQYSMWVQQVLKAIMDSRNLNRPMAATAATQFDRLVQLVCSLDAIGHDQVAFDIAKLLCHGQVPGRTGDLRSYLMFRISSSSRRDWSEELLFGGGKPRWGSTERSRLADSLSECDAVTLGLLYDAVKYLRPTATLREQISWVCQIARVQKPSDLEATEVLAETLRNILARLDRLPANARASYPFSTNLHALMLLHGQYELASAYVRRFVNEGDVEAMLCLAEEELAMGSMSEATNLFSRIEQLAMAVPAKGASRRLEKRLLEEDFLAVKTLVGRWIIAKRVGDTDLELDLRGKLEAVACTPLLRFRLQFADYLRDKGENSFAIRIYQALLPLAALSVDGQGNAYSAVTLYDVARKWVALIHEEKPAHAARLFDVAVLGMIDSSGYRASAYVTLPLLIQEWALDAAIRGNDRDQVTQCLNRILELDPLDISFAEERLPQMREAGMVQLADSTLDSIMDAGMEYARRFSLDAMTCNNVAWVAAKNERRLQDALKLATFAVRAEPESTTYRDTLAEVLFLLGRTEEALQIEKACLLDDPGQWHLHEQIEKYTEALQSGKP